MDKINFENISKKILIIKSNGLDWSMEGKYTAKLKENIQNEKPLKYLCEEKELSFKPVGLRWNNALNKQTIIKQDVDSSVGRQITDGMEVEGRKGDEAKGIIYKNALGEGINIGVLTHKTLWRKILKISSLKSLGKIPANAEFLEVSFEIENTFGLKPQEIKENRKLGKKSWIRKAKAWDSFQNVEFLDEVNENGKLVEEQENRIDIKSEIREVSGKMYLVKQIPVEWLKTALFPIYTDTDITYGTASEFEDGITVHLSCCEIDTNKFVVCYSDSGDSNKGKARIATVSGTTIIWGTISIFSDDISYWNTPCKLDTDKFVVVWRDATNVKGKAKAVTVSGTTIGTWGTESEFSSSLVQYISSTQLDTNKFVVCYQDWTNSYRGKARVASISGTTLTWGTESQFESGATQYTSCCKLDTDKFVVVYEDSGDSGKCKAVAVTVSGTTIGTWGTIIELDTNDCDFTGCCQLDTDKFVAVWAGGTGKIGQAKVCTVSGTTITAGTLATFESGSVNYNSVAKIDSTHFVVVYEDDADADKGKSNYCSFSGTTITVGTPEEFESGAIRYSSVALISSNKIVIAFQDDADSDKGKAIIGDVAAAGEDYTQTCSESVAFSVTLTQDMFKKKLISLAIDDSFSKISAFSLLESDILDIAITISKDSDMSLDETFQIIESLVIEQHILFSEALAIIESISIIQCVIVKQESLNIIESSSTTVSFIRILSDILALVDVKQLDQSKIKTETLALIDSLQTVTGTGISLADTLSITSAYTKLTGKNIDETLDFVEIFVKNLAILQEDSLIISDNILHTSNLIHTDIVAVSDDIVKTIDLSKANTLSIAEVSTLTSAFARTLYDLVDISEDKTLTQDKLATIQDEFILVEVIKKAVDLPLSASVIISDIISPELVALELSLSDTVDFVDLFAKHSGYYATIVDNFTIEESYTIVGDQLTLSRSDLFAISEILKKQTGLNILQTISFADDVSPAKMNEELGDRTHLITSKKRTFLFTK